MGDSVSWLLELDVNPGREEAMRALMAEMVKATRENEPGTMIYEWNLSDDGRRCHLLERYADSAAALTHLGTFGTKYVERFLGVFTPTRLTVYGAASPELKEAMAGFGPTFMATADGFAR